MRETARVDAQLPPGLYALPGEVEEGFTYPDGRVAVFRRDSLLGRRREARRRTGGRALASFADLKVGDLVVHAMQGIGRFEGLVAQEVLGSTRDYMQVSYRGGDTLFVPYEQMELLHKYVGGDGARLDKLGGATWAQVTDRVRKRVKALAGELLRLHAARASAPGFVFPEDGEWERELEESFPYQETPDQESAISAVKTDMQRPHPMDRLVCGDVGFGKTEVSVRAAFKAALAGKQTMMLAPTTILVQQHERTFKERLGSYAVRVESLSRFTLPADRRRILADFQAGEVDVLVGTHALLGSEVRPRDLGLVVVDEEQRFGVRHKERIKEYKTSVDVLTLTATPIPRTMQMGLASLRDISVIETPPAGRRSILTHVGPYDEELVEHAIEREVARGGTDLLRPQPGGEHRRGRREAARTSARCALRNRARADARAGAGGSDAALPRRAGRCPGHDHHRRERARRRHGEHLDRGPLRRYGARPALPASGQDRTLHGAGLRLPICPSGATIESQKRLEALMDFTELGSGFAIAMRDLEIRGAGNLLGAEQSGHIAAVGFEMYLTLLEEAVAAARGEPRGAARGAACYRGAHARRVSAARIRHG